MSFTKRYKEGQARVAQLNRLETATLEAPGSEQRLEQLQSRFRSVSPRPQLLDRRISAPRLGMALWLTVWATCVGVAVAIVLANAGEGSMVDRTRHLIAYPNCDMARVMGIAPAVVGEPGYWPEHDRDRDGVACEVFDEP